jgi:hypothetical protein
MSGPGRRWHRFVPATDRQSAHAALDVDTLTTQACASGQQRAELGRQRLTELLTDVLPRIPALRHLAPQAAVAGLAALPLTGRTDYRDPAGRLVEGAQVKRRNRTSGSTNTPVTTALGEDHERNQVLRWLRHWDHFGVRQPAELCMLVPRTYRLRLFGGGDLVDLAGGHQVRQLHPADRQAARERPPHELVVANPHVLEILYPDGFPEPPLALVTSYEQAPWDLQRWAAGTVGDVYGLSEVGDVAYRSSTDAEWTVHEDLVHLEVPDAGPDGLGELVVTDLTNHVMPLLRYRTGDLAVLRTGADGRPRLRQVIGRRIAARGTCLAGLDLFSWVLPALLDTDSPFRLAADAQRAVVWVPELDAAGRTALARRLDGRSPIVVAHTAEEVHGLNDVLVVPRPPGTAG